MLVLSRKVGEVICIGEHVKIMLVRVGPNTARLGITAPREMSIVREELGPYTRPEQTIDHGGEG